MAEAPAHFRALTQEEGESTWPNEFGWKKAAAMSSPISAFPNPEEPLAKAEIARRINHMLAGRKLTRVEAGKLLGIPQPRVSDLARGRLGRFSLEKLIDFAKRLGNDVEIRLKPSRTPRLKVA